MADKYILQLLVFNENGTHIDYADCAVFKTDTELMETADVIKNNYLNDPEHNTYQLMLVNNTTGKVLYNSKGE